ncbi:MAG: hypothetical protein ACRDTC_28430 [Pseudonocardiaceae bacterium]
MMDTVMQRDNERGRVVVAGRLVADGQECTFLVIHERSGGSWAIYPHGVGKLGVRLAKAEAVRVAEAILAGAR